jgi:hypothetical protein
MLEAGTATNGVRALWFDILTDHLIRMNPIREERERLVRTVHKRVGSDARSDRKGCPILCGKKQPLTRLRMEASDWCSLVDLSRAGQVKGDVLKGLQIWARLRRAGC